MTGRAGLASSRRVFIDALNVAYWCGAPPSLRFPLALLNGLLDRGQQAVLYFDASARYRLANEAPLYERLKQHPDLFVEVPSGRPADRAMLRQATTEGACVVSRDLYRDHRRRFRKLIDDPARLLPGSIREDRLFVPQLALALPMPKTLDQAWQQLETRLRR